MMKLIIKKNTHTYISNAKQIWFYACNFTVGIRSKWHEYSRENKMSGKKKTQSGLTWCFAHNMQDMYKCMKKKTFIFPAYFEISVRLQKWMCTMLSFIYSDSSYFKWMNEKLRTISRSAIKKWKTTSVKMKCYIPLNSKISVHQIKLKERWLLGNKSLFVSMRIACVWYSFSFNTPMH